jgi:lipid A 4'-phosphatase
VKRAFLLLALATVVLAGLFLAFPGIDRAVEHGFLRGEDGRFRLDGVAWADFVNRALPWLMTALAVALVVLGIAALRGRALGGIGLRQIGYLAAVFLLGPALLANLLLKDQLGRVRPRDIPPGQEAMLFTPPFVPSDACPNNCSFPAGDAAAGYAFLGLALALPRRGRAAGVAGAIALGSFLGAVRMLQGAHYFSDVIFAGLLMALVAVGLHLLWFRRQSAGDAGLTGDG